MTPSEIYDITNPYASGCSVQQATIKPSTSADGWKYHKRKKIIFVSKELVRIQQRRQLIQRRQPTVK